jgi:hypothetical protein
MGVDSRSLTGSISNNAASQRLAVWGRRCGGIAYKYRLLRLTALGSYLYSVGSLMPRPPYNARRKQWLSEDGWPPARRAIDYTTR